MLALPDLLPQFPDLLARKIPAAGYSAHRSITLCGQRTCLILARPKTFDTRPTSIAAAITGSACLTLSAAIPRSTIDCSRSFRARTGPQSPREATLTAKRRWVPRRGIHSAALGAVDPTELRSSDSEAHAINQPCRRTPRRYTIRPSEAAQPSFPAPSLRPETRFGTSTRAPQGHRPKRSRRYVSHDMWR